MAQFYSLQFGAGDPRTFTGLAPTFLIFVRMTDGQTIAPPAISEALTSSGIYQFSYGVTQPIAFLADAATTSPGAAGRYIQGQIDPSDRISEFGTSLMAYGNTNVALGTTNVAIGTTGVAYGVVNAALGTTSVAYGVVNAALGTTSVALGTTNVALGTSIFAGIGGFGTTLVAQGSTLVAIGNTAISYGVLNLALGNSGYSLEQSIGNTLVGVGNTAIAIGTSGLAVGTSTYAAVLALSSTFSVIIAGIGSTASSYGNQTVSPGDLFGYMKRVIENLEGDQTFYKASGVLDIYARGTSTLLREKTVSNSISLVVKSGS